MSAHGPLLLPKACELWGEGKLFQVWKVGTPTSSFQTFLDFLNGSSWNELTIKGVGTMGPMPRHSHLLYI